MTEYNGQEWPLWKLRLGILPVKEPEPEPDYGEPEPGEDDDEDSASDPDNESDEDESIEEDDDGLEDFPFPDEDGEEGDSEDNEPGLEPLPAFVVPRTPLPPINARAFASWSEFVASAADDSLYAWHGTRQSHARERASGFYGTESFDEAVKMATITGWPEGRKLMQDTMVQVQPKPEPFKSIEFSVAGAFPMVPNFCAGDPECMVIDPGSSIRHSKPVVRIDYSITVNASVDQKSIMLRGAAVLSLADMLEARGFSTEIRVLDDTRAGRTLGLFAVVFKRAGEPLDIDRAAFAMAHPSVQRRLFFACYEQHAEAELDLMHGYGSAVGLPFEPNNPDIIFIGPTRGRETPDSARAAVAKAAEKFLASLDEAVELEHGVVLETDIVRPNPHFISRPEHDWGRIEVREGKLYDRETGELWRPTP